MVTKQEFPFFNIKKPNPFIRDWLFSFLQPLLSCYYGDKPKREAGMEKGSLFQNSILEAKLHPEIVAYYFKQWQDFRMAYHTHDATEIMYMISGVCQIDVQAKPLTTTTLTLKKGEFILLDANVPHRLIVEDHMPCRMLNVEFRFKQQEGTFPSMKELAASDDTLEGLLTSPYSFVVLSDPDEVYHALKSLILELDRPDNKNKMMIHLLFAQLLFRIARLRMEAINDSSQQSDPYVKQCMEFMHHNYDRDIQAKDIAKAVNLHPGYLHRIFKAQTGTTLTEYLTILRMEKAKMLLLQTDIPIMDISDYVGVGSRQYFHSLFKKHTKLTPTQFRNSMDTHKYF
jgi:AraC-like DNA-binding protein/quercetin dioxygenase-like cupin family protein